MRAGSGERLRETSIEIDVPFRHVDLLGVVWHGHYYAYMEEARTALLRACDLDAGDLIGSRYLFYVIESRCRYTHPLHYRDRVRVTAWLRDVQHRVHIAYELTEVRQQQRVARGHTILATTDSERRLLLETPDEIQRRLRA
jgi:acyl-CoA thioester hydrolase